MLIRQLIIALLILNTRDEICETSSSTFDDRHVNNRSNYLIAKTQQWRVRRWEKTGEKHSFIQRRPSRRLSPLLSWIYAGHRGAGAGRCRAGRTSSAPSFLPPSPCTVCLFHCLTFNSVGLRLVVMFYLTFMAWLRLISCDRRMETRRQMLDTFDNPMKHERWPRISIKCARRCIVFARRWCHLSARNWTETPMQSSKNCLFIFHYGCCSMEIFTPWLLN